MKGFRKKLVRAVCVWTAALSVFSLSACDFLEEAFSAGDTGNSSDPSGGASSLEKPWEEWEEEETDPIQPTPDDPDATKTVVSEEIDDLGHKLVYYSDGSCEDLGRALPLDMSSPAPESQYGYQTFAKEADGEGLCAFYTDLYTVTTAFHKSTENLTVQEDGTCEVAKIPFDKYGISAEQAISVWKVFGTENPAYYWLSPMVAYSNVNLYLLADGAYAQASVRSQIRKDIEEAALDCDTYLSSLTSVEERALTIYDYLIYKLDYAYEADGVTPETEAWAHNIVGATKDKGVCETYAKTYDYFCGLFGLDCLTVTGMATQDGVKTGHAWNYVSLSGEWYAVDSTWGDQDYLLRSWFGKEKTEFFLTHEATLPDVGFGIEYQYALPTLAEGNLAPVFMSKDGGNATFVASVDKAFATMDEGGRYEITLYPDTAVTAKNDVDIYPLEASFYTALPKVQSLTFSAEKLYVDATSYYQPELASVSSLTLRSTLILKDVELTAPSIDKNGYLMTSV